jgi:hypothetical protein
VHTDTATSRQPIGGAETYFIRSGYRSRDRVEYFLDETDDTVTWQPDVYPYAAAWALKLGRLQIGLDPLPKGVIVTAPHEVVPEVHADEGPGRVLAGQ